jgi:putative heme-binding domain-containing protein
VHKTQLPLAWLLGALLSAPTLCRTAEPWADTQLTVTNGLALWFDVSRQNAARGGLELAPLRGWNDGPDFLVDGSGHRRDLSQPVPAARPLFRQDFDGSKLLFDGTNDFLFATGLNATLTNATVFVVAAPRGFGGYRALLSGNERGRNDYTSGLNLDFGSTPATNLIRVNAEGAGFGGERDLLGASLPADRWHVFALVAGDGPNGVKLFLDGAPRGTRPRTPGSPLRLDEFRIGARHYSNTPDRPGARDFFSGVLTEVLVFDRALADGERLTVESYLSEKYGALLRGITGASAREGAVPLVTVTNPAPVQVLIPGFSARELPVELNNLNNVRYRPDGKLVAVGYDGRIWLLSDANDDGLEDKAEPFWDKQTLRAPIGAALTPPGYARGQGVFVAAKEKLSLILDTNRDDRADEEIVVATWTERSEQQGVDALAVALAPDGSVYFCLGAASFTEPFQIDKTTGQARYRTTMERGTIQRVSPDFSKRETVCTGIRFAVGLAFNRHGDLFATEQEGATWLPNGNPFDELLHIQPGRHYGFPPRHPRHLPDVIDEPSVFDYTPQHQSTCGLWFNELPGSVEALNRSPVESDAQRARTDRVNDSTVQRFNAFGPAWWSGDVFVAGYSRGKLWRTKLVKTAAGYVAQTHLFATLQMLTVDACVSPRGDLLVATHSGQPDWGTGPNGQGKLWRIRYEDQAAPQPVAAWNASPTELKIAFDRPLDPVSLKDLASRARLESGQYVAAGDRFETLRPGYQVVYDQLAAPRYAHEVLSANLSPDHRTLTLLTKPRTAAVNYALAIPVVAADVNPQPPAQSAEKPPRSPESAHHEIDLLTDLTGVEATWESSDGKETRQLWLPHLDLEVARAFTLQSAEHAWSPKTAGTVTLRGQLDLFQMLQPAVQPGATLDYVRPPEDVTVRFESSRPFEGSLAGQSLRSASGDGGRHRASVAVRGPGRTWAPFEVKVAAEAGELAFTADWSTADDSRPRAFPLRRFLLPWAKPADTTEDLRATPQRSIPEIAGGKWLHGRRLFFSDQLACAKCHTIRGEGGRVGPDLSNLVHRDYASVRKDIQFPNAALNPDHLASEIELTHGEALTGILLREADGVLTLADATGQQKQIPRAGVKSVRPSQLSLMPEGIWDAMSDPERRDLMTFLLTVPLEPHPALPEAQGQKLPPPRRRAEVEALLENDHATRHPQHAATTGSQSLLMSAATRIVLCASPKDAGHGAPGFHDYPLWRERWAKLLALADGVTVETAESWPTAEQWARAKVIAFYHDNPAWSADKAKELDDFLARGGGLVFLHWSMNAYRDVAPLAERLGRAWGRGSRFRYGLEELRFQPHDITAGFATTLFTDESYWNLTGDFAGATVLATCIEDGQPQPQVWVRTQGKGRVFVCIPGHFTWTFDDPLYRVLVLRGICWVAGQPLDRLGELATIGARLGE